MRKILLTGCNGQLGRAIQKEYVSEKTELVCTDVIEQAGITALDITKVENVLAAVRSIKPDVIINCAAYTNVDQCEKQWNLAYQINAIGPRNLSIAAADVKAKMIHVSTDYVFDGKGTRPYTEFDAVGPVSAYGKTKLEGERFVQAFAQKYFILRTAWLYGDGNNFVKTMLRLAETHDAVNVVCDQLGSPTSASELARMIHYLEETENYGLFHGTCEGDTNWADFAEEVFRLAGRKTKVNHITSEEYKEMNPASANRPAYSILENYMIQLTSDFRMDDWRDSIKKYLTDK
ncbi:MAG: dTDP-4-dehydrorhamnose reductase [Bacteroides sp.]|nr:dTDP-4-dehydrorhamnose reductase [Bacteroides sp.]MCM1548427.1 dTDP-4-dehydrorhamnose reductase [Clostridium sp.]